MAGSPEFARGNGQGSVSLAASLLNLQVLQNPLGPTLSRQVIRVWHRQYHTICFEDEDCSIFSFIFSKYISASTCHSTQSMNAVLNR